ncbi:MAG: hypothetical protein GXO47_13430 [Chlorobi bacterium]|nr:hypothetical protein [Chlorobiota bacterium]
MKLLIFIITLTGTVLSSGSFAQEFNYSGAVSMSQAGINTTERDIFSPLSNPAGITGIKSLGVGISYICPYAISKLSNRNITAVVPTGLGHFAIHYGQAGYSLSLLNLFGFSYARTFGNIVSASLSFNGLVHKLNGNESFNGFFATTGIQIFPSDRVTLGILFRNISQSKISYSGRKEDIPVLYAGGILWTPADYIGLNAEIEKDKQFDPVYKFGMFYKPVDFLILRGGIKGSPVELSFGTGYSSAFFSIDAGIAYHSQLGVTSGASLTFSLTKQHRQVKEK